MEIAYDSVDWMHAVRAYVKENLRVLRERLKEIPGIEMAPRARRFGASRLKKAPEWSISRLRRMDIGRKPCKIP